MYKLFKHKKGIGFDDLLPYVFVVMLVIVIILLNVHHGGKKMEAQLNVNVELSTIKAEQKLLDFLEKKVEIGKENITIADMISSYYSKQEHGEILAKETEDMLNSLPKPASVSGWNLDMHIMPEDEKIIDIITYNVIGWFERESIIVYLPLPNNPERNIKLKLWLECQC